MINRRWLLARRPQGPLALHDFEFHEEDLPPPDLPPGHVLVRHGLFACAATMRTWMAPPGRAHRSVDVGAPIRGPVGAHVVASRHPRFAVGARVTMLSTWEDYAVVAPDASPTPIVVHPPEVTLVDAMSLFGLNTYAAYFGLIRVGQAKAGETVVVSAAAGSVGSTAVRVAKILGCRVVGIAGGRAKCDFVTGELGADAAIDYKHDDVAARLRELCPDGVDVFFDNVGGAILDAVLERIATKGRVALCGQVASYDSDAPATGLRDVMTIIQRSVTLRGFVVSEFLSDLDAARADVARWRAEGRLALSVDLRAGFESLPSAFVGLFRGESRGTLLVASDGAS